MPAIRKLFAAALIIILAGAGCLPATSLPVATPKAAWQTIGDGLSRYDCRAQECGSRLIVYRFAKDKFAWHFVSRAEPSTVEAWAKSLPQATIVANGVYFDAAFQPTGLLKTAGGAVNPHVYDLKKSALLELAPSFAIIDTSSEPLAIASMTEAAQSYPLLIKRGAVQPTTTARASRRTVIGDDQSGDIYLGSVPEDAVTFAQLAALLEKTGIKWDNVLNLDGGTSTGFAAHDGDFSETMNSIVQVPNVIVAERK